jgi:hypothetical protein
MSYANPIVATGPSTALTAATEVAVVTTPLVAASPVGGQGNVISGMLSFTSNASASVVVIKIRQGSGTGGTTVYTSPAYTTAAAQVIAIPFAALDTSAAATGVAQYTVTANATLAGTAAVCTAYVQNAAEQD